jgi:hypothetical protein
MMAARGAKHTQLGSAYMHRKDSKEHLLSMV